MLNICCVLRSGGRYTPLWVKRLKRNVEQFAPQHRFVCLSDCTIDGIETVPLKHEWPTWWPIIEVFRPGLFDGRVLYCDLADIIVDDIKDLCVDSGFIISRDPAFPGPRRFCSGVMAFDATDNELYTEFKPEYIKRLRGDQDWIAELRPKARKFPEEWIVSYKAQCKGPGKVPAKAKVVLFHGVPKPPEVEDAWVRESWDADWGLSAG